MPIPLSRPRRLLAGLLACLVALPGALASSQVQAAPVRENIRLLEEARRACVAGDHARGTEILTRLLAQTGHPSYLHNQARCDEQNGRDAEAAQHYRDFLREARELPRAERAQLKLLRNRVEEIEARIAALEASAAAVKTAAPGNKAAAVEVPPAPPSAGAAPSDAGLATTAPTITLPGPTSHGNRSLMIAGIAAVASGGAILLAGFGAGLMARNAEADLQNARDGSAFDVDRYHTGQRAATVATAAFVAAPILIGVGAGLLWRSRVRSSAEAPRAGLQVLPLVAGTSRVPSLGGALVGSY